MGLAKKHINKHSIPYLASAAVVLLNNLMKEAKINRNNNTPKQIKALATFQNGKEELCIPLFVTFSLSSTGSTAEFHAQSFVADEYSSYFNADLKQLWDNRIVSMWRKFAPTLVLKWVSLTPPPLSLSLSLSTSRCLSLSPSVVTFRYGALIVVLCRCKQGSTTLPITLSPTQRQSPHGRKPLRLFHRRVGRRHKEPRPANQRDQRLGPVDGTPLDPIIKIKRKNVFLHKMAF